LESATRTLTASEVAAGKLIKGLPKE